MRNHVVTGEEKAKYRRAIHAIRVTEDTIIDQFGVAARYEQDRRKFLKGTSTVIRTVRENIIREARANGCANAEIAKVLCIKDSTVEKVK